jgi:hypothetical protein
MASLQVLRSFAPFIAEAKPAMRKTRRSVSVILVLATVPLAGKSSAGSPLLDEVLQGNRASIDSIRTLSCRVTNVRTSPSGKTAKPVQGEYWKSDDKVRVQWAERGFTFDAFCNGAVQRILSSDVKERRGSVMRNSHWLPPCDALELALLTLPLYVEGRPEMPFDELLQRGQNVGNVSRKRETGHECIVVELIDPDDITREIWFEPKFNYLAWKTVFKQRGADEKQGDVRTEKVVLRFVEAGPSIFFPAEVEGSSVVGGKPNGKRLTTFSDIHINEPIPPDVFDFRFPKGTHVFDNILGKTYVVDEDGNPVGEQRPLPAAVAPPVRPAPGDVSRSEPARWSSWFLPCSLGLLAGAGGIWFQRRWQEHRPTQA